MTTRRKFLTGALVGAALGMALVLYSNRVGVPLENPGAKVPTVLHPSVEPSYLVRIVVQSVLGAVLASLWPARHASRLKPIEALAHV
mgnify:CR=1 FL=1